MNPFRSLVFRALTAVAAVCALPTLPAYAQPLPRRDLRETVGVSLAGAVVETWELVWTSQTTRYCNDPYELSTCPCAGFEFADQGSAAILRIRGGMIRERFPLDPLFAGTEGAAEPGRPTFPRWALSAQDHRAIAEASDATVMTRFVARPAMPIMVLQDYNGDGVAAEFVMQVEAGPCGHRASVLVGLDASERLHVFGITGQRAAPVVLRGPAQWEALRGGRAAQLVQCSCGDHGSDHEDSLAVRWVRGEPVATARSRRCRGEHR